MDWIIILVGFILGSVFGSFIKAISDRSLDNRSFWGRSYCESCKYKLKPYDLFPILSYLFLQGKCRSCHKRFGIDYLLIEIITGVLFGYLFYLQLPADFLTIGTGSLSFIILDIVFNVFLISIFLIVLLTDIKKGIIPDRITYPALILAFGFLFITGSYKIYLTYSSLVNSQLGIYLLPPNSDFFIRNSILISLPLLSGITASIALGLFFGILIFVTKGRGMGGGDLKLAIFMGMALGFPGSLVSLLIAFLTGSVAGIILLLLGKKKFGQTIPFGPFLSLGGIATIYWGQTIVDWYLNLKF